MLGALWTFTVESVKIVITSHWISHTFQRLRPQVLVTPGVIFLHFRWPLDFHRSKILAALVTPRTTKILDERRLYVNILIGWIHMYPFTPLILINLE